VNIVAFATASALRGSISAAGLLDWVGGLSDTQSVDGAAYGLSTRNSSAGTAAYARVRVGNSTNVTAFTIDVLGGGFTATPDYVRLYNQLNAPLCLGANAAEVLRLGAAGDIGIATTKKFYFDGVTLAGNTYIAETSADNLAFYVGGAKIAQMYSGGLDMQLDLILPATKKLYLDNGSNTYLSESSADVITLTCGGTARLAVNGTNINATGVYFETDSTSPLKAPNVIATTGTVAVWSSGVLYGQSSSERYKDVRVRGWRAPSLTSFLALRPILFDYKNQMAKDVLGFSAEELDAAGLGLLVNRNDKGLPESLRFESFLAYQHLVAQDHEARLAALEQAA
jgi:hypothetical protein